MGRAYIAVGQSDITITRSIMRETAKQLIKNTGFPEDATIIFDDESVTSPRQLKNYFDGCYNESGVRTNYKNYVFIDFNDTLSELGWVNSKRKENEHPCFYLDEAAGVSLQPQYLEHEAVMTMRFRCNDKTLLNSWINLLKATDAIRTHLGYVDIRYDYSVPAAFLEFIYTSWEAQQKLPGPKESLEDHLTRCFSKGTQKRSNLNGTHTEVIRNEIQNDVEGLSDDAQFYNTREIQRGIYEVVLTYTFRYNRIMGVVLKYPALIHNSFIEERFLNAFSSHFRLREEYPENTPLSFVDGKLQDYEIDYYYKGDGGARMVTWDDWFPTIPVEDTQTVLITPIQVDLNDPNDVFNITDLPESLLPEGVGKYLVNEGANLNRYNESLVNIFVHEVGAEEKPLLVTCDSSLNLRTVEPMDPRKRNYVRISLKRNIASLHPEALKRLLSDVDAAFVIFKLYDDEVELSTDLKAYNEIFPQDMKMGGDKTLPSILITDGKEITPISFTNWVRKQQGTPAWFRNLIPSSLRTVGDYKTKTGK